MAVVGNLAEAGTVVRRTAQSADGTWWLLVLPLAFLAVVLAGPLVFIATTAVQEKGLAGGVEVVTDDLFLTTLQRTVVMAAVVTAVAWVLGVVYSLALALARPAIRSALLGCLVATFWMSLVIRMYGWVLLYQPDGALSRALTAFGLRDHPLDVLQTTLAMYPAMVHVMLPLMVVPMYASLRAVDPDQIRAAQSLGARWWTLGRRVLLPQMRHGSAAGITLVFLLSLGFYVTPAFLGGPEDLTIGTLISRQFYELYDFGAAAVMGTVTLAAILAGYVAADRLFGVAGRWGPG